MKSSCYDRNKQPYTLIAQDGAARLGEFETLHGSFSTPNFMPVATCGTVKGIDIGNLESLPSEIILVNTYHLWLRPGHKIVEQLGGIHKFTAWQGPILSDSGGFQVYSLQDIRKLTEEGVEFRSHLDGTHKFLSPELAIEIQETLGVDIAMVLDECPDAKGSEATIAKSLDLTLRWAKRSLEARKKQTAIFGITQGALFPELRKKAAEELAAMDFDGLAIGGLSVGETQAEMYEVLSYHVEQLPKDKIRYLMGVGTPRDLVEAVSRGVDLFDCVMPTRSGRFGRAFVSGPEPQINIRNACYATQDLPLDENCNCLTCTRYSRAYLNHLFKAKEMLGPQLLSLHNLSFYLNFMQQMRLAIEAGEFQEFYNQENTRWAG